MPAQSIAQSASWSVFYRRWGRLRPPLRPHADVCALMRRTVAAHAGRTLLLGVTPELARLRDRTVAVDFCEASLTHIWPGDGPGRRAIMGNWLELPCAAGTFSAVLGDGSFNCLEYPAGYQRVFDELARVVQPGGRIVVRMYVTPDGADSIEQTRRCTMSGGVRAIDALKWRLAHAVCAETGDANVPVQAIREAFNRAFPDRRALLRATGWSSVDLATMDAYALLPDVFSFPTLRQVLSLVPATMCRARFVRTWGYELAERCPALVMDRR
ncbi:MAG TPA: methyltransferase domain-containing protein [Vicinamibacterales bacterium]|nr:methyltransferase domain-containing protein [Vicinamibacterales bacterium]